MDSSDLSLSPIVVFGTEGQVARSLRILEPEAIYVSRAECDFTRPEQIRPYLERVRPRLVINPAAFTDVDRAEKDFAEALSVNAESPAEIARWCAASGASLVHYSTDYVYSGDGENFWRESDPTHPLNKYGESKWRGEQAVTASGCHHVILRTSWVYSPFGKNFVRTMIRLGQEREALRVVNDQIGSPTYAFDLAEATVKICAHPNFKNTSGVFNTVNSGTTSWYGLAAETFKLMREFGEPLKVQKLEPIPAREYPLPAARPSNSRMNTEKLEQIFGVKLRAWDLALKACLEEMRKS